MNPSFSTKQTGGEKENILSDWSTYLTPNHSPFFIRNEWVFEVQIEWYMVVLIAAIEDEHSMFEDAPVFVKFIRKVFLLAKKKFPHGAKIAGYQDIIMSKLHLQMQKQEIC